MSLEKRSNIKIFQKIVFILIFLLMVIMISSIQANNNKVSNISFQIPNGDYNIGTHDFYWIDKGRAETLSKDPTDKRKLMVRVWYPTDQKNKTKRFPYIFNPAEFGDNKEMKKSLDFSTNSILDASISKKKDKFPVLIFSHGMRMTKFSNTSQIEHLVSHGYIVFGIDHTFFNRSQKYPDGYIISEKAKAIYKVVKDDQKKTSINTYSSYSNLEKEFWLKDTEYVLKKIRHLNKSSKNKFYNKLDLDNIGMFGYTMDGITTMPPFWLTLWFKTIILLIVFIVFIILILKIKSKIELRYKKIDSIKEFYIKNNISNREREVIKLIVNGKSNKEIEELLFISIKTVNNHKYNIYKKLKINNNIIHFCPQLNVYFNKK